ncbi:MAG TPA: polysaccharide deacetylase family protein [Chryseolinea sp.]|nr:polysaccharide deacetylase family protein [Chryseolinea sp.]
MKTSLLSFILIVCLSTILSGTSVGQQAPRRYVAITFDDLPVVCQCENDAERMEITEKLIATFKKYKMPILAVVNEQKLESNGIVESARVALLQKWLDAGFELGNHGYSHKNINEISFEDYKNEILKGERVTRPLSQKAGLPYRFYRHPYLSAGDNLQIRKDLDTFLKSHNYVIAPNTITYQDYTFSGAYDAALRKGDTQLAQRIREAYLPYTLSRWEAAEKQSVALFGREIKQILMVHANRINADAFDEVAKAMQDRGYFFISIDEAMKDPAYARPDSFDGKVGVTWLSRWSAEQGKTSSSGGTQVPEFVLEAARH